MIKPGKALMCSRGSKLPPTPVVAKGYPYVHNGNVHVIVTWNEDDEDYLESVAVKYLSGSVSS